MEHLVNVTWENNMKFTTNLDGHQLTVDASEAGGGNNLGPRPKNLMLVAVAGCTGMDVISILKKMQVDVTYFNLRVEGHTSDEHPKKFLDLKIIYEFRGTNLEYAKLEKAVNLSVEKYCGVNANYRDAMKMSYEIRML
jgi:putative redox protein